MSKKLIYLVLVLAFGLTVGIASASKLKKVED
jgi:hypothetical protein